VAEKPEKNAGGGMPGGMPGGGMGDMGGMGM
jgi:chaperonin GroEL